MTTPAQLERLNPGLPDPVPADRLLTVPLDYITGDGETLTSVAVATGLDESILRRANRSVDPQASLPPDSRLLMPRLFVVYRPTSLDDIAELLMMTPEDLRAFNPELVGTEMVVARKVLVVPFQ